MRELVVFACVGIAATATHYSVAILLVELLGVSVLSANVVGYCGAVSVSYFGHSMLTFRVPSSKARLIRYLVVSLSALILSQLLLAFLTAKQWFHYKINMGVVVTTVPVVSYLLSKFWVYRER